MAQSAKDFVRDYALSCYTFDSSGDKEDKFIARLLHKHAQGKRILDLGCGPVVPITSVFYPNATEVVAVDRLPENLDFVLNHANELDKIVERAKQYRRRYLSRKITNPKIELIKGDVTKPITGLGTFDCVMNLGCFGALDTAEQFQAAVNHAYSYLKKGGTLLMINWVGKNKRPFQFNGKMSSITEQIYVPSMHKAGFKVQEVHTTARVLSGETKELGYDKIIWAVAKK